MAVLVLFTFNYTANDPPSNAVVYAREVDGVKQIYVPCNIASSDVRLYEAIAYSDALNQGYVKSSGSDFSVRGEKLWIHIVFGLLMGNRVEMKWACDDSTIGRMP
ncbi:MAG: hypothetical protein AAF586_00915 [Planctomycetota bacterium]